jgi:hypothetical protein
LTHWALAHSPSSQSRAHAEDEEGQGEDEADEEAALLVVEFGRARGCFRVFHLFPLGRFDHIVASGADGADDVGPAELASGVGDDRFFVGVVHVGRQYAIHAPHFALDVAGAVGAGHACDGQLEGVGDDPVAGVGDALENGRGLNHGGVVAKGELFAGVVDFGRGHALHFFGFAGNVGRAVGAGHAGDGDGEFFGSHSLVIGYW